MPIGQNFTDVIQGELPAPRSCRAPRNLTVIGVTSSSDGEDI